MIHLCTSRNNKKLLGSSARAPLKVLFVTPRYYPDIGGVEKHVKQIVMELVKKGFSLTILTASSRTTSRMIEYQKGIRVVRCLVKRHSARPFSFLYHGIMWVYIAKNFRLISQADTIHLHDTSTFLWLFPYLFFIRKPIYITFHGFDRFPIPFSAKIVRRLAEKRLSGNICVGGFLVKWYGTNPDYVILGGVESSKDKHFQCKDVSAVFIGRLANDTGIMSYISALKILKKDYGTNLCLHICGDGPLKTQIEKAITNDNLQVVLHGFKEDTNKYFERCRFAFVTGYLSILEAMANQNLVFTYYDNALKRDYINSFPNADSLMVISSSPQELAKNIFTAITNGQVFDSKIDAASRFAAQYSWSNVSNIYERLYNKNENS